MKSIKFAVIAALTLSAASAMAGEIVNSAVTTATLGRTNPTSVIIFLPLVTAEAML